MRAHQGTGTVTNLLRDVIDGQKSGRAHGVTSICSAHPLVLEAAVAHAVDTDGWLLIEATSNQVNQFGGYTGMRPVDFVRFLRDIAAGISFPAAQLWIGGDHLGPNAWRAEPADLAMGKAGDMVREYAQAGFRKIHLDCSMACARSALLIRPSARSRRSILRSVRSSEGVGRFTGSLADCSNP